MIFIIYSNKFVLVTFMVILLCARVNLSRNQNGLLLNVNESNFKVIYACDDPSTAEEWKLIASRKCFKVGVMLRNRFDLIGSLMGYLVWRTFFYCWYNVAMQI